MRNFRFFILSLLIWSAAFPSVAFADDAALLRRVEALEQELNILKRQLEVKKEDEDKKKAETPIVTASAKDGFSIKSPDDTFRLKVRGLLQTDARIFDDNRKDLGTTDTLLVRRARAIFEGTVYEKFGFYLMPDFGNSASTLTDGYAEYLHSPQFKLRLGKFKEPLGLERLQSDSAANFTEAGLTSNLLPNRDTGVMAYGDVWGNEVLTYQVGYFNGSADNGSGTGTDIDTNNDKDVAGRIFAHPFKTGDNEALRGLGLGVGASHGHKEGSSNTLPTFRSPGQVSVFTFNSGVTADGPHSRLSPQAYYYNGPFGVLGEYVVSNQELIRGAVSDKFKNTAWQVSGTYVLTGEDASYKGVKPRKPFDLALGQWGAFEIALRYGELDLDDELFRKNFATLNNSITQERAIGTGLNWYLNNNVRVTLDYEHTEFDGGAAFSTDRPSEDIIFTRFQLVY